MPPSRASLTGRTSSQQAGSVQAKPSDAAQPPTTGRKRSNTKNSIHPPSLKLFTKSSSHNLQASKPAPSPLDARATPFPTGVKASPSHSYSAECEPALHAMHYGTQITASPLMASPDTLSSFPGDMISSSLPATLSALAIEPGLDLVSPSVVSPSRRPSSPRKQAPSVHNASSPSLSSRCSNSNLRVPPHSSARSISAPTSRQSSAGSVDRDTGLNLDMKRLLSKPARSHYSGSSVISLPSDPELSSPSLSPRLPSSLAQAQLRSKRHIDTSPIRRATDDPTMTMPSSDAQRVLRASPSRISLPSSASRATAQKQRNVLRRKNSSHSNPSTPTAGTFPLSAVATKPAHTPDIGHRLTNPRRTASATAQPVFVPSVYRVQELPSHLTPAGAVAHAYKQQEQRREQLAEISGSNEQIRQTIASPALQRIEDDIDESGGIYYTVVGSASGKVVAVGSMEDSTWDLSYDTRFPIGSSRSRPTTKQSSSSSGSVSAGVRTLTRKVSGRFGKKPGVGANRDPSPYEATAFRSPDLPYDGRPSTSDSKSVNMPQGRALGPSMDEYVDVIASPFVPSFKNGGSEKSDMEVGSKGRTLRTMRSFKGKDKEEKEKEKEREGESSPGGKIWKLVKRISQGGLRDKYSREATPPPVPALPKDLQKDALSRATFEIRKPSGRESPDIGISRFMQSRSSMSAVRPYTAPQNSTPRKDNTSSRPSTGPRPSTTTRSSSPMSSDIASSRFFPKSHSVRSSVSSYGDELPPLPNTIGQNILPPSELYKLNKGDLDHVPKSTRSNIRGRTRSMGAESAPAPGDEPRPSLPPPRRHETHPKMPWQISSTPPSPLIPTFNTDDPVNNFMTSSASLSRLSLPTSEFGVPDDVSTPPRPRRSSRRRPPPAELVSPTPSTPVSATTHITPRTPRSPNLPSINVSVCRASMGGGSPRSAAMDGWSNSPSSSGSHATRSPIRFRELESPRVHLTDREKAARWDDLLQRSDEAGGTLHLGESGLMSDNLRFSQYSDS